MPGVIKNISKPIEGVTLVLVVFMFIHFLIGQSITIWNILVSLEIIFFVLVLAWTFYKKNQSGLPEILTVISAIFIGFWLFSFLRYLDIVKWPLGKASNLSEQSLLLRFHLFFSLAILFPLFAANRSFGYLKTVGLGRWNQRIFLNVNLFPLLIASLVVVWSWVISVVNNTEFPTDDPAVGFIAICLLKAFLTGLTEEICFRGALQHALSKHFGVFGGILLQSCCYMVFHFHLGEVVSPKILFLISVWILGLIFGIITHLTSGIGWAIGIHTAIDVIVECGNLS